MPRPNPETKSQPWSNVITNTRTGGQTYQNGTVETYRRTYTGVQTSGFPNVKPLPFNSYTLRYRKRAVGKYTAKRKQFSSSDLFSYAGDTAYIAIPFNTVDIHVGGNPVEGSHDILARGRCISKIQRLKANVAQNIAEYRQVDRMFMSTTRRIANAYRALRRGDAEAFGKAVPLRKRHQRNLLNRGPLDIRRHAPSIWLETQYGWLPLLGDTYTALTEFYSRVEQGVRIRAMGTGTATSITATTPSSWSIFSATDFTRQIRRAKYIVDYEVDTAQLANMNDWGITNPALLAWELVPYSFVVDWFFPIGDWLSQVGYSLGLYFVRGMKTGFATADTVRVYKPAPSTDVLRTVSGSDYWHSAWWQRTPLTSFPSPGRPQLDPGGLRGKRIANALSLLALAFDRK